MAIISYTSCLTLSASCKTILNLFYPIMFLGIFLDTKDELIELLQFLLEYPVPSIQGNRIQPAILFSQGYTGMC